MKKILDQIEYDSIPIGKKTLVVVGMLPNGHEIVETCTCASSEDFDELKAFLSCKSAIRDAAGYLEWYKAEYS